MFTQTNIFYLFVVLSSTVPCIVLLSTTVSKAGSSSTYYPHTTFEIPVNTFAYSPMPPVLSDEIQLGYALEAFGWAHKKGVGWATQYLLYLKSAGISSMSDLSTGCKENTVNLDLELFGIPAEEQLSQLTIQYLRSFLPGPMGFRCFRLAQMAAAKVRKGQAVTEYVHRPESGKMGKETWDVQPGEDWIIHVDCAGFVRNCLKHTTKDPFVMALSDRPFMRAKDFFSFFSAIPYSVMDKEIIPESDRRMNWRIVPDLRMIIPGDVICYRPKGNAAGGAAFTKNDRKDLHHVLRAVKTAQLWHAAGTGIVTRNVARDPLVERWVTSVKEKLASINIRTAKQLRANLDSINAKLEEKQYTRFYRDTLKLMKECVETTATNTGHIVFAAGPAVPMGDNEYRVRVVHSTRFGFRDQNGEVTTGVQEYFRRFTMIRGPNNTVTWTRGKPTGRGPDSNKTVAEEGLVIAPLPADGMIVSDEEENPNDDMEEDPADSVAPALIVEEEASDVVEPNDELAGQAQVEVIAARMCF